MNIKLAIFALLAITLVSADSLSRVTVNQQENAFVPRYIEGCLQYSNGANQCLECQFNYQRKNNICVYNPASASTNCCAKFDSQSRCIQCSKGLILRNQNGLCVDSKLTGCIARNQRGCAICDSRYTLVGGRCVKSIANCASYNNNDQCASCQQNSVLSNGVCVVRNQVVKVANCNRANEFGCFECVQGYRASNGQCVQIQFLGCLRYNKDGKCSSCEAPFYTLEEGVCEITGCLEYKGLVCSKCNQAFGFVLANNRCEIPNCIYFDNHGCTNCRNNLVARSEGCRPANDKVCIICKNGQYLSKDGVCLKKSVHCSSYKNGVCVSCIDKYYLNLEGQCLLRIFGGIYTNGRLEGCQRPFRLVNNKCVIAGCLQYNQQGCSRCHQKLTLDNLVCTLPFCQTFDQSFVCVQCLSGYQLNPSSTCVQIDVNCAIRNSLNSCTKCNQKYTLNSFGRCVSMKQGCNYVDGRCTSCRAPFIYVPQSESCFIDGCVEYFLGGCRKCQDGYKLLYNSCKLPNCLISNKGKCQQCDPDYVFNSKRICVSKDQFCDQVDQTGKCIKCMNSYYFSVKLQKCLKKSNGCLYNAQDQCYACQAPFNFDSGRCLISGCLRYDAKGCTQCSYPYIISDNRTCFIKNCAKLSNDRCVQCVSGYTLDDKYLCRVADKNCVQFNDQQTKCTKCIKGYRLDENNRCQYSDENCNFFDRYGECANCDRLYFLNPYNKCQLRDPQCITYTNGYCSKCKPYHFSNNGICFANLKGCNDQRSYSDCRKCDKGYVLQGGLCKAEITKLDWNSIDMDFQEDGDKASAQVFSYEMTNKLSLIQAIRTGKAQIFFSSSVLNNAHFQIDTDSENGWAPQGKKQKQFIGVQTAVPQIFYAFQIRPLAGSKKFAFNLQYSQDGKNYDLLEKYNLNDYVIGVAKTYYIKPVQAKFVRIALTSGQAHIKIQFYYSNSTYESSAVQTNSFISKTVTEIIDGVQGGISSCKDSKLCWAGVQTCQPTKLAGFQLVNTNDPAQNYVTQVKIDYSTDGMKFTCYDNCKNFQLVKNRLVFDTPILAEKVHVHFTKYVGNPKFGIKFNWLYN